MTQTTPRVAAAPHPFATRAAWSATALVSLIVILGAVAAHGATPTTDAGIVGRWISDKNDPAMDYRVAAGPEAGTFILTVPSKALGGKAGETVTLRQTFATKFESAKGSVLRGSFTLKDPRHAEFRAMENTRQSFHVIDQLLERP